MHPINNWFRIHKKNYTIVIADTPFKRKLGLQRITQLQKNVVVLFTNIQEGSNFHTNNCFINIDIVPIDKHGKILSIWSNVKPNESYIGPFPKGTMAVLEANAHWFKRNRYQIGSIFVI